MADERHRLERQEFRDDFRLAVYRLMQFVENELGNGRHRVRPDDKEWRLQRAKTIEKLNELIDRLDRTCVAANYGKGIGIGAEVAGEVTSIIAAIMKLGESSSAETIMSIGNFLSHSGSLLEGASNAVESFVSAKYISEINEVLKRDQELSMPLQEWLAFSRNLDANIREIFGCDLNFAIQNNVLKVFSEFIMLYSRTRDFQQAIDLMKRDNCSMDIDHNVPIERLFRFSSQLEMYPELHDKIHAICFTLDNSAIAIQVAREGIRVYRNLFGEELNPGIIANSSIHHTVANSPPLEDSNALENDKVSEGSSRFQIERDQNREIPTVKAVSTFCAFQTINVAVNLVHLSTVIMTVKDGKSKYSHALQQISNLLSEELRSMEAL
ncbi:hypothetical protein AVEN_244261-1 [Araneus ventricosus]|nr:hypothetical protein AVEN_244261-1 [Araneus ventricosus]